MLSGTSCQQCCWVDHEINTTNQKNCKLGMLDKFRAQNAEIIECYNENGEFFVIKDRMCPTYRSQEWQRKQNTNDLIVLKKRLQAELKLRYDVFINATQCDLKELLTTMNSIREQTKSPQTAYIALTEWLLPSKVIPKLQGYKFQWKVSLLTKNETYENWIDQFIRKNRTQYYIMMPAGYELEKKFIKEIENYLAQTKRFSMLEDGQIYVVQTQLHKYLYGNKEKTVVQKIRELAVNDQSYMVINNI